MTEATTVPESAQRAAARSITSGRDTGDRQTSEMFSDEETGAATAQTITAGQLRAFIERVERLEEEKATIAEDIKQIFGEARGAGFDVKAMRTIIRLRKKDQAERQEEEAILDLYLSALGMA